MHQISIDVEVTAHDVMRERESETERETQRRQERIERLLQSEGRAAVRAAA